MVEVLTMKTKDEAISKQMAEAIDIDNNNKIYWNEFLSCFISEELIFNYNNLMEVFDFFDRNKKGYFDANDLIAVL
jgi:Ca2+-binding EF-hand superfamily protein